MSLARDLTLSVVDGGIAAANVEVEGTDVCATTIHSLFDLDGETYKTKLDFAKKCPKVNDLVSLDRTNRNGAKLAPT